jgi:hypothetical protein
VRGSGGVAVEGDCWSPPEWVTGVAVAGMRDSRPADGFPLVEFRSLSVSDPYLKVGKIFQLSGELWIQRIMGMRGEGGFRFWVEERERFRWSDGTEVVREGVRELEVERCGGAGCRYTIYPFTVTYRVVREVPEGEVAYRVKWEVVRERLGDGTKQTVYRVWLEGAFLVDKRPPFVELVDPGEGILLTAPVGVTELVFSVRDEGRMPSCVGSGGVMGRVEEVGFMSERVYPDPPWKAGVLTAEVDLSGRVGKVIVVVEGRDRAANQTIRGFELHLLSPLGQEVLSGAFAVLPDVAPVLGITDPVSELVLDQVVELLYPEAETEPDMITPTVSVRFQQVGPGGFPVLGSGITLEFLKTGEFIQAYSGYTPDLPPPPVFSVDETRAEEIGVGYVLDRGWLQEVELFGARRVWVGYREGDQVLMQVVSQMEVWGRGAEGFLEGFRVDVGATGEVLKAEPIRTSFGAYVNLNKPIRPYEQELVLNQFEDGFRTVYNLLSFCYTLETDYIDPDTPELCYRSSAPSDLRYGRNTLEFAIINSLVWNRRFLNFLSPYGFKQKYQADTYYPWWEGGCDGALGWTQPSTLFGSLIDLSYCFSSPGPDKTEIRKYYTNYGGEPGVVVHETTHGVLFSMGVGIGSTGTWMDAFHEGFAQTNACQYFWDAGIGRWNIYNCRVREPDYWGANDEHDRGGLLTYALLESRDLFDFFSSPYIDYVLPPLISYWRAASGVWFSWLDWQLGRFLSYLAGVIRNGNAGIYTSSVDDQENLISLLLYRFQFRGMPVGSQVSQLPPYARMIGVDGPFGYSACYNNFSFKTVGSLRDSSGPLSHTLAFWVGDPLSSSAVRCPVTLTKTPSLAYPGNSNIDWLGSASFTESEVASALQSCRDILGGNPRWIENVHVEAILSRGGSWIYSTRNLGLLRRLPRIHVVYQPLTGSCESGGGGGGGCTLRSLPSADLPPGFFIGVGLWGILFFLLWRVLRRV